MTSSWVLLFLPAMKIGIPSLTLSEAKHEIYPMKIYTMLMMMTMMTMTMVMTVRYQIEKATTTTI